VSEPHSVLGVAPDAPPGELAVAYRELAKRWHPDLGGGAEAERRMAEINAAYDLLRSELVAAAQARRGPPLAGGAYAGGPRGAGRRPRRRAATGCPRVCGARWASSC
jgi:curved DNA-binding protein